MTYPLPFGIRKIVKGKLQGGATPAPSPFKKIEEKKKTNFYKVRAPSLT